MKPFAPVILIAMIFLLSTCSKSDDTVSHINCDGIITDTIGTGDTARIYMPNAFTPNNDGLNDIIRPYTRNIQSLDFTIYDANNNILFSTTQQGQGWSGPTVLHSGTLYYYKIQAVTSGNHHIGKCGAFFELECMPARSTPLYFEDQITADGFTVATLDSLPACP